MARIVWGFAIGLIASIGMRYYGNLPPAPLRTELAQQHCGVPANIDAYASCLAKHNKGA